MRPDKKAIVDEVWDDARIEGFLDKPPMGDGETADFSILLNAYRSMRVEDFARFLPVYKAAGKLVDAPNKHGQSLSKYLAPQRKAVPFIEVINHYR